MNTQVRIDAGKKGREEGFQYEKTVINELNLAGFDAEEYPQSAKSRDGRKGRVKTDFRVATGGRYFNISLKNPKTPSSSIQVQIISLSSFIKVLEEMGPVPQVALDFFDLFFGGAEVEENCKRLGIDFSALDYDSERRRFRLKFDSIPEEIGQGFLEYFNQPKIVDRVLTTIFREGNIVESESFADHMLWCDSTNFGKGNTKELVMANISDIVENIKEKYQKWIVRESMTVLEIGPVTLQMKGSGKKKKPEYHSPQFNASISDIENKCDDYITSRGTLIELIKNLK
jgi:hypothetical protein